MFTWSLVLKNLSIYWKTLFTIIYPVTLLPIIVINNTRAMRCLYVITLMAGYWVFEVLPLAITAMIPIALFPTLDILNVSETSMAYFKEGMMFVGGLIIALSLEFCNLHTRVSLHVISLVGCSYRRLNFSLVVLTMLISMWMSNTAATAMMIPIVTGVFQELEKQGLGRMWEPEEGSEVTVKKRRPTRVAMCFYMSIAYAASFGGFGAMVGSATNLVLKEAFDTEFVGHKEFLFNKWIAANVPLMLAIMYLSWLWMQVWYMGMGRPHSADAKAIRVGKRREELARRAMARKLHEMGKLSPHEMLVGALFLLVIVLWFLRKPGFMPGWPQLITETQVGHTVAAILIVILLFMFPANMGFLYMFHNDETKRPKAPSPGLITWNFINHELHWNLLFLMGGGFALADGINSSGMGEMVANKLETIAHLPSLTLLMVSSLMAMVATQIVSNAAVANILLPIMIRVARKARIHPLYLMMPVTVSCSFAYCLPGSSPPNAIAAAPCNMRTLEMIKIGLMIELISFVMLITIFPVLGAFLWDLSEFPEWAEEPTTEK